ncbi:MAG: RusA family crossover junction endodeoxyribonuclease [Prevotella sp.]|nr:RusA family crossover junction endodeoxyribonuclease [Prevotella sp.]
MEMETIYGQVVSKANSYMTVPDSAGGRRIIKNEQIRAYERSFLDQCRIYRGKGISRPFRLHVTVFESSNAYDIDNALKTILDCLQYAGAIANDNLCIGISATKKIDRRRPRVVYGIEETEPTLF